MMFLLRTIAVAIAVAALIDPVWTAAVPPSRELIAIDLTDDGRGAGRSTSALRATADKSGPALVDRVVAGLQAAAPRWHVVPRRIAGTRVPCGPDERCVVIADGSLAATVPADAGALSLITVRRSGTPNVALRSAVVTAGHASAAGVARVEMSRTGTVKTTAIRVHDGAAIVGSVVHSWGDGPSATIDVPWWPVGSGARALRIEAVPADGEAVSIDNVLDVGATIGAGPIPVLVFDARPSWGSTFVRRALEDDARFAVRHRARVAPGVTAGTSTGSLDVATLEASPAVLVGGPDALTAGDVALLERYVSARGGSLIMLPERQVDGPARRLIGDGWSEQLVPAPQRIGPLRATEILRVDRAPIAATVIGTAGPSPSIVVMPSGRGRVIVSGAMDAWRYRDADTGAFDRFWTSLVGEAAAEGRGLRIDLADPLAAKGERVSFTLRDRTLDASATVEARVTMRCGSVESPVRMWPSGERHEFVGEMPAMANGQCDVAATVGPRSATTAFAVAERPRRGIDLTLGNLERAARASGGVVVEAGNEPELVTALDDSTADSSRIVSVRPMRVAWWMVPFAACLAAEWWLRRRAGLR